MGHGTSRREFVTKALMGAAAASLPLTVAARAASNSGPGPLRRLEAFVASTLEIRALNERQRLR